MSGVIPEESADSRPPGGPEERARADGVGVVRAGGGGGLDGGVGDGVGLLVIVFQDLFSKIYDFFLDKTSFS